MIERQRVMIDLAIDGDELRVCVDFEPGIAGSDSETRRNMPANLRMLQNLASHAAAAAIDALRQANEE